MQPKMQPGRKRSRVVPPSQGCSHWKTFSSIFSFPCLKILLSAEVPLMVKRKSSHPSGIWASLMPTYDVDRRVTMTLVTFVLSKSSIGLSRLPLCVQVTKKHKAFVFLTIDSLNHLAAIATSTLRALRLDSMSFLSSSLADPLQYDSVSSSKSTASSLPSRSAAASAGLIHLWTRTLGGDLRQIEDGL